MNTDSLIVTLSTAAGLAAAVVIPLVAIVAGMRVWLKVSAYFRKAERSDGHAYEYKDEHDDSAFRQWKDYRDGK